MAAAVAFLDQAPPGPAGTLQVEVELADGEREAGTFRFTPDSVVKTSAEPDACIEVALEDLVDLASGAADGALLYLAGRIRVRGDESLVLAIGRAVRVPGARRALVDPAALDPDLVAEAIRQASAEHLAQVMSGGFRDLVLSEVFRRVPEFLIPEKADGVRVTVGFDVEGRPGGGIDRYVVTVDGGLCTVTSGVEAPAPVDATLILEGEEFLRLVLGQLNPVRGVLSGRLRVQGSVLKALGFHAVMRIPGS